MGPDLKKGLRLDSLRGAKRFLGHVDGEPVLLICEDESVYAIGATCSHYGADLSTGITAEGTIRCPWHHACFDYKTGEATKAPALKPIPTWRTEVKDGIVFVREKNPPRSHPPARYPNEHFVIVGSGAAGHAAAEMLRRKGFAGQLTVLSEDSDLPYDRPNLSKDYLAGTAPEEWMPLRSADFYQENHIDFRLRSRVRKLEPKEKVLKLADGHEMKFDKCLLATGGTPVRPAIEGLTLPHVFFLRSMADCRALLSRLTSAKKVLIVGAGFIGLEAAAALRTRKLDVTIVAPNTLPLSHVVGEPVAAFLKEVHEANGVHFRLKQTVTLIEPTHVKLSDGTREEADLVLVATGIAPNTSFAKESGLSVEDGITVNAYLETSCPGVFAAGDVALYPDPFSGEKLRVEHWVSAQRQGQVAALNMLGERHSYSEIPFFWTHQFDVSISYVGHTKKWDKVLIHGDLNAKDCSVTYYEGQRVAAVLTIGRDTQSLCLERAFEQNDQAKLIRILTQNP